MKANILHLNKYCRGNQFKVREMLKINDRFETERDKYQWLLHEWTDGQDKHGNPKKQRKTTYHASLKQVCEAVIDRQAGDCEDLVRVGLMITETASKMAEINQK